MTHEELKLDKLGRVAVLSINRPARRNALSDDLVARMRQMFHQLDADDNVGALVLSGQAPGFCAGSDLKELGAMSLDEMCAHESRTAAF